MFSHRQNCVSLLAKVSYLFQVAALCGLHTSWKVTGSVLPTLTAGSGRDGLTVGEASAVALQLRPPPKVSVRAPAHRSYHLRGVKLKSCIKKIHHNLYISKQANVRIKHADTEGASHKKIGTDARVQ